MLSTNQGESQMDAKYDQFFLGDYRPLVQDTHGNALNQETQLAPYRRNMQDLLCDASMIPYTEPYQSIIDSLSDASPSDPSSSSPSVDSPVIRENKVRALRAAAL
ncbi:hypothetical protein LOK49_Contig473G00002 [Camellia lanceoleosa]|nr:hypothetical protein LOK49_Contig473G00002 [Camellia lanceoleosa]